MKRSEMVDLITIELYGPISGCCRSYKVEAEAILRRIEEAEMLPPSRLYKSIPWGFQMEWEPEE